MRRASDPLFAGLVDDAALFPPGSAAMDVGLAEHVRYRSAAWAAAVGPFLCPASRIDELREALPAAQELRLSLVFDVLGDGAHAALRSCAADDRLTVAGVEAALATLGDDALAVGANLARLPGATGFLEVPRTGFEDGPRPGRQLGLARREVPHRRGDRRRLPGRARARRVPRGLRRPPYAVQADGRPAPRRAVHDRATGSSSTGCSTCSSAPGWRWPAAGPTT